MFYNPSALSGLSTNILDTVKQYANQAEQYYQQGRDLVQTGQEAYDQIVKGGGGSTPPTSPQGGGGYIPAPYQEQSSSVPSHTDTVPVAVDATINRGKGGRKFLLYGGAIALLVLVANSAKD